MPDVLPPVLLAALFGLLAGSFLNVVIHRWPRDLSVVAPRSMCPHCAQMIAWYDNVPVASFVLLGGRCRHCRGPISPRYPMVELLTAILWAFAVWRSGISAAAARDAVCCTLLLALVFADLETRILPDQLTLGGAVLGLVFAWLAPRHDTIGGLLVSGFGLPRTIRGDSVADAALGALVPAGILWLTGWLYEKLRHREGLGFGDVKMVAMLGAFLGLRGALVGLILGSVLGSIVGLVYIRVTNADSDTYQLPLGSFLGVAGIIAVFAGEPIMRWYEAFLG